MPLLNTQDGFTCHYFEAGAGDPVLLLHGSASAGSAKRVTEHLSAVLSRADSIELAGAGHMSQHTHADLVAGHIRGHIAATTQPRGQAA